MKTGEALQKYIFLKILICICIGLITWKLTWIIPHPITLRGVDIGDVGVPIYGFQLWMNGEYPYGLYHGDHEVLYQYPFTGLLALAPLSIFPLEYILPIFLSLSATLLTWGLLRENKLWRLLVFLSFPYFSSIYSGQLSLLVSAAILLPILLPVAVIKPQSCVVLLPNVPWNRIGILMTSALIVISFILFPGWITEWIKNGNIEKYDGWIPLVTIPGILLISLFPLVRVKRARLLLTLSLMPQRIFYDQISILLLPKSYIEMLIIVIISWIIAIVSKQIGWIHNYGQQDYRAQLLTVVGLYLPMLYSVLRESWRDERNLLFHHSGKDVTS